jgi:uracil-DNA glycosylase
MEKMIPLPQPWIDLLSSAGMSEICDSIADIERRLDDLSKKSLIFPAANDRYRAFSVPPESVKAAVVAQDPYHGLATVREESGGIQQVPEAMGLSFSVPDGVKIPPSLRNIFKELNQDIGCSIPDTGDLTRWADHGVLLMNRLLSVEKDKPGSHKNLGWQRITEALIAALSQKHSGIVFLLWGNHARSLRPSIADNGHTIIESSHPSSMGGSCYKGFFGSRPFSRTNSALVKSGKQAIDWRL